MADIVIRKRISFDFLGDEYKNGYVVFRSLSYDENVALIEAAKGARNDKESLEFIIKTLKERFIEGQWIVGDSEPQDIEEKDIGKLSNDAILECFERIVGSKLDPKV